MRAVIEGVRRRCAVWVFRLANVILRGGISLHQQGRMSRDGLRAILSMTRSLERLGKLLVLGLRWHGIEPLRPSDQDKASLDSD